MIFNVIAQDYTGMDKETLDRWQSQYKSMLKSCNYSIKCAEEAIASRKAEVKQLQKTIVQAQNELLKITEAYKTTAMVQYDSIMYIDKHPHNFYVGKGTTTYYLASDYKTKIVYEYAVYNVNVLGSDKGKQLVQKSAIFETSQKSSFVHAVLDAINSLHINKVILLNGATINKTELLKANPNLVIEIEPTKE